MWTETLGHRAYRLPYLKAFFSTVAGAMPLTGREDLLDLGCGAGEVALGFAPHVATLTAVDFEQPMLEELARRARAQSQAVRLVHSKVEEAPLDLGRFHLITIGSAHWFLHNAETFARLERWLVPGGRVLVCNSRGTTQADWPGVFGATRSKWAVGDLAARRLTVEAFFQDTVFEPVKTLAVPGEQKLELDHLLHRAQGFSTSSPAVLDEDSIAGMEAELRSALAPFFRHGPITESFVNLGYIYRRLGDP